VGFPPGVTPPTWLDQSANRFSCTPSLSNCTLVLAITDTTLPAGTYTTTIRFGIRDTSQNQNFLALRDVQLSYIVQPQTGFAANPQSLSFSQLKGAAAPAAQNLGISELGGASYPWNASIVYQSGSGWLNINGVSSASGTTLPTSLSIGVNSSATLGTLNALVRVTGNGNTLDVPVSYTVSEPTLTRSPASLTFNALRLGPSPASQDVTLTTQSSLPVPFTTVVSYGAGASGWLNAPANGTAPGTVTASVNTTTLAPGSYTATLGINTAAQALSVSVTYVVSEPTLTRSPAQLTFNAPSTGTLPATQDVTLSTQQNLSLGFSTSISYGGGATGWLSAPANGTAPGLISIGTNTTNLVPGTYTATLTLTTAAQTVPIGITYVVATSSLTFSPASPSFTIDTTSLASAISQNVTVGSTGVALSWTATPSQPWAMVSPTSGSSPTSVTLSLDPSQLDTLDPGTRSATITFAYTPPNQAPTSAPLSVSLNLKLPKVASVNPYVATSGTSLEVIVRGFGFSNPGGATVNFGSGNTATGTVVSDTELRVSHPVLTAGTYRVSVPNQLGNPAIVRSAADLVVANAPAYLAATIAYPDLATRQPLNIIYDAERKALLVGVGLPTAGAANGALYRYTFSGSAWSATPAVLAVSQFRDLALSLDGKRVIAATDSQVKQFDSETLAAGISTDVNTFGGLFFLNKIAVANDGKAVINTNINGSGFTPSHLYSIRDGVDSLSTSFLFATSGASGDGSRVVLAETAASPAEPIYVYSASTSTFSPTNVTTLFNFPRPAVDRSATRVLIGGPSNTAVVYDANFQKLGNLPGPNTVVALSPGGSKAYTYLQNTTVLHTYNLNGTLTPADPDTGLFPEIGTGTSLPSNPGLNPVMTVSPDGGNLFIAGDAGIVVVPAP